MATYDPWVHWWEKYSQRLRHIPSMPTSNYSHPTISKGEIEADQLFFAYPLEQITMDIQHPSMDKAHMGFILEVTIPLRGSPHTSDDMTSICTTEALNVYAHKCK